MKRILYLSALIVLLVCLLASCDVIVNSLQGLNGGGGSDTHIHSFGPWECLVAPTCTSDGKNIRYCDCGESDILAIPVISHTEEVIPAVAPKCETEGLSEGKKCSVCNTILLDPVAVTAKGHNYGAEIVREHSYDAESGIATDGLTVHTCVNCGDSYEETFGHSFNDTIVVPSTCVSQGYEKTICDCGYSYTIELDFAPHTYGCKEYAKNEANICGCEWENPYVINCEYCGIMIEFGVDGAPGHVYSQYLPVHPEEWQNPCTWAPMEYAECDNCDCYNHGDLKIIGEARGHVWGEWLPMESDGHNQLLVRVCVDCGEREIMESSDNQRHEYAGYTIVTIPTETAMGLAQLSCTGCYESFDITLPPLGSPDYEYTMGDCLGNPDIYRYVTYHDEFSGQEIDITFEVFVGYVHDEAPPFEDLIKVQNTSGDRYYYVYRCSKCGLWIVAHTEAI